MNSKSPKDNEILNFQWSFKYLLIGMRIIGLKLDDRIVLSLKRYFGMFVGASLLVSTLIINFKSLEQDFLIRTNWKNYNGYLSAYSNGLKFNNNTNKIYIQILLHFVPPSVEHLSQTVLVCGNHLIFFFILLATNKWKNLWSKLMLIQQEIQLSESFYQKCRKRCFFGLGLLAQNFAISATVSVTIIPLLTLF